jgi:hypothetical protein
MNDVAAHLVDHVLPSIGFRQYVCTFPHAIRYVLAYDRDLCAQAVRIFVDTIFRQLRRRAKQAYGLSSVTAAHPGAVTFVQRFDSALRLNLHLHCLLTDGVYTQSDNGPRFLPLPAPSHAELLTIAQTVRRRLVAALRKSGRYFDDDDASCNELASEHPSLAACYGAALSGTDLWGPRAGQPALRLG